MVLVGIAAAAAVAALGPRTVAMTMGPVATEGAMVVAGVAVTDASALALGAGAAARSFCTAASTDSTSACASLVPVACSCKLTCSPTVTLTVLWRLTSPALVWSTIWP